LYGSLEENLLEEEFDKMTINVKDFGLYNAKRLGKGANKNKGAKLDGNNPITKICALIKLKGYKLN
jgi:hypothetical protein